MFTAMGVKETRLPITMWHTLVLMTWCVIAMVSHDCVQGDCCGDIFATLFCHLCVITQLLNEVCVCLRRVSLLVCERGSVNMCVPPCGSILLWALWKVCVTLLCLFHGHRSRCWLRSVTHSFLESPLTCSLRSGQDQRQHHRGHVRCDPGQQ